MTVAAKDAGLDASSKVRGKMFQTIQGHSGPVMNASECPCFTDGLS